MAKTSSIQTADLTPAMLQALAAFAASTGAADRKASRKAKGPRQYSGAVSFMKYVDGEEQAASAADASHARVADHGKRIPISVARLIVAALK